MNQKQVRSMAAVSIAILILLYVGFYFVNRQADSFTQDGIVTEPAMRGQVSDTLQARGFAIRDEEVLEESFSGVLNYRVASGTRVSQGGVIAEVYQSENDAAARMAIASGLEYMGVKMDEDANNIRGKEAVISAPDSKVQVLLIPTNEELMIAMDTAEIVGK